MGDKNWRTRVVCDADLHHGEPCIKGTRIPVSILVASLAGLVTVATSRGIRVRRKHL